MQKIMYYITITTLLLTLTNCKREDYVEPMILKPPGAVEIVWSTPLNYPANWPHLQPLLVNNTLILGAMPTNSDDESIYGFDKRSGQKLWEWKDYLRNNNYIQNIKVRNNTAIISYWYTDYVVDILNGSTLWSYHSPLDIASQPRANAIGDNIYHAWEIQNVTRDSIAWLMRSSIDHPQWDTVITLHSDSGYSANIEPPVLWISPTGDSILIFQNRSLSLTTNDGRIDLLAFNLNTKNFNWRINDITTNGNSSIHFPIIFNNYCFFLGDYTLHSINLLTGHQDWEYMVTGDPASNNLAQGSCIVVDNKIYLKTTGGLFSCLDANTGNVIWKNDNAGFNPTPLNFYKNKLYYMADHQLYCVDSNDGKVLFRLDSPNENHSGAKGSFVNDAGLVIDPSTNLMYFTDSYYATCIKVPE